nr:unnamed protein product [Digitaria exilis]
MPDAHQGEPVPPLLLPRRHPESSSASASIPEASSASETERTRWRTPMLSPRAGAPPPSCPRAHSTYALAQLHAALAKSGLSTGSATPATAAAAARACARLGHLRAGRAVHGASAKLALLPASALLPNALLHMYASCPGDHYHLQLARLLFDTMPARDAASYNILLTALAVGGHVDEALELFDEMPEPNF